ncbi:MAG: Fic family protein [Sphingobacteriales bacterium]|nr:MAG: Fic family protein [Sphingobacteriales bacterium]
MVEQPPKKNTSSKTFGLKLKLEVEGVLTPIINDYLYWDKVKYKQASCTPQQLWACVKLQRLSRGKTIAFGNYDFRFLVTDTMQRLLHGFDMHLGGNLSSNIGIAETDKNKFMLNSIMEEAISSSQIEGAATTRKKAKEMIRQEKKPRNKSDQMILNNFITMKHISEHKQEKLTPEGILYVHKLMAAQTLDDKEDEGRFRDNDEVRVVNHSNSEVVYTPPVHTEIDGLIADLCKFFNEDSDPFIHPIVKACIIHFMIGWIHPFTDGNGRTARALFYWYMLRNGYWLTEFMSISRIIQDTKGQYERAYLYTESDENDMGYFIHYHLKTMEKAFIALKEYINKKQREVKQAAAFMKIPGVNDRMAQIIKLLSDDGDRAFSTKEIENMFAISNFTARTDLKTLADLGFLEVIAVNKKKQQYIKSAQFDKLINKVKK